MLAHDDVAGYLLARGLIGPESIVDGELAIRDVSSRNRNFSVRTRDGAGLLLKQGVGPQASAVLAHEAGVYEHLGTLGAGVPPGLLGFDAERAILAIELIAGAEDMRTLHLRLGAFPPEPAAALGAAVAELHRRSAVEPVSGAQGAPWVLSMHRPGAAVFRDTSAAGLQLIRIIQGTEGFAGLLDAVRDSWRVEALVHGDLKWDNCLARSADAGVEVRIVDWETALLGDPAWDVGTTLSQYLTFWLSSIPVSGADPPERFPELAAFPLDAMKPALAAFWLAYVDGRGLDRAGAAATLGRSIRCAAARLLQTAFEAAQMTQHQLTSALVLHLQLAFNLLTRPDDAGSRLLGLSALAVPAA